MLSLGVNALAVSLPNGTVNDGQSYAATGDDESAIDVSGNAQVTVTGAKISKTRAALPALTRPAFAA